MSRSSRQSPTFRFSDKNVLLFLISLMCSTWPAHIILLDFLILMIFGEVYKFWSFSLSSLLQPLATSSLSSLSILLSTPFSHTLNLCSFLSVRDYISPPYSTTGKIIVFHILIFKFLERRQKKKDSEQNVSSHSPYVIWSWFLCQCNFYLLLSFPNTWTL